MNKRTAAVCLSLFAALFAAALTGCGEKQKTAAPEPLPTPAVTEQTSPEPSAAPAPEAEKAYQAAMAAYAEVLDQTCDVVYNGISTDGDYPLVAVGVMEVSSMPRAELLRYLGYAFEDVSGDGVPELFIGTIPDDTAGTPGEQFLFGGYACKDGKPVRFLEGWSRNVYEWMGGGRFYNFASNGWAYSGFGTFRISPDGTELSCEDLYFSDTKGEDNAEVVFFHNTTGVWDGTWDSAQTEELDIDSDAFWALSDEYEAECRTMELTPFADYEYTGFVAQPLDCKVRVDYFEDVWYQNDYIDAAEYLDGETEYETRILFRSDEDVADFKLLALTLRDVDAEGNAIFDITEVFGVPALRAELPLAVPMSFPGDIPSNGFCYTEADGMTKTYSIGVSGRDGSLLVVPLD